MKNSLLLFFLFFTLLSVSAQTKRSSLRHSKPLSEKPYSAIADSITIRYADSLAKISSYRLDSSSSAAPSSADLLSNPYYYRLFVNPLVYKRSLSKVMELTPTETRNPLIADKNLEIDSRLNDFFVSLYTKQPNLIHNTDDILEQSGRLREDFNTRVDHNVQLSDVVKVKEIDNIVEPIEAVSRKPNFWTFNHTFSLQLLQNYANDKWYQGGNDQNSMLAKYKLTANYNNKEKITFNNTLEMNLGFQTNQDDTHHKYKTTEDLLRLTNNLGIQATGRWYYSIQLQSWTQFCRKFNSNSDVVYSDFMSPFESVLSIGMDYKPKGKLNFTLHLAPLAYDFKYVGRKSLTSRYGIPGDHHAYETYGSNITAKWNWKILNELAWESRLYYFTNYEKVQVEWENTFVFTINKYLSSKLYLYPRFDDSYYTDRSNAVIQFKEYLSLGLDVKF